MRGEMEIKLKKVLLPSGVKSFERLNAKFKEKISK